jgi:hypothetical protein
MTATPPENIILFVGVSKIFGFALYDEIPFSNLITE